MVWRRKLQNVEFNEVSSSLDFWLLFINGTAKHIANITKNKGTRVKIIEEKQTTISRDSKSDTETDYRKVYKFSDHILLDQNNIEIVSGSNMEKQLFVRSLCELQPRSSVLESSLLRKNRVFTTCF